MPTYWRETGCCIGVSLRCGVWVWSTPSVSTLGSPWRRQPLVTATGFLPHTHDAGPHHLGPSRRSGTALLHDISYARRGVRQNLAQCAL